MLAQVEQCREERAVQGIEITHAAHLKGHIRYSIFVRMCPEKAKEHLGVKAKNGGGGGHERANVLSASRCISPQEMTSAQKTEQRVDYSPPRFCQCSRRSSPPCPPSSLPAPHTQVPTPTMPPSASGL